MNGGVNPNGAATTAWFEWGTSPTLATFNVTPNQSMGSGTTSQPLNAAVSGLSSGTPYYFRVAASNATGTAKGSIASFTTTMASAARLWIPAVSGTLSGKMSVGTDYASNSLAGTVVYPNTTEWNTDNHTQADAVAYTVTIPAAGTWYLWSRMYYPGTTAQPTNDPNSFWVAIDSVAAKSLGNRTDVDRIWHWEGASGSLLSLGNVSAGNHTLRVWNREARETAASKLSPRLDVFLLTNDAGYIPNDVDAANALYPSPTATTNAATSITATGGTVNGGVNPNGAATTAWFEWGTSPTLATFSSTTSQSMGSGTTSQPASAALSGLASGTPYYFRAAASNAAGTVKGSILSFTTTIPLLPPTATTNAATAITATGGTVNGGVNPNGAATTAWFEWGTSPTLATFSSTTSQSMGSGTTSQPASAALSGLTSGTPYYFRAAASNAAGTVKGSILSFSTTAVVPTATTNAATSITATGGTVNGGVNPNGAATTAWFEWGTSPTLATFSSTTSQSMGSGTTSQPVSAALSGLTSGTPYYFRAAASNAAGTVKGSILSFSTTAVVPTVTTNAATAITATGGTVNGGVNPNGAATTAWFEWGTSPTLATFSSTTSQSMGSGTTSQPVSAALSGLTSGTPYYFRAAASNAAGTVKGSILSFSTTAVVPTATTNAATSITATGGTVNGGVNPNGAATTAWFEWGTSPTLATFSSTTSQSMGSGTTSQAASATLSGLTSGTPYYFRAAASNAAGTVKGSILSFTTSESPIENPPYPPSTMIKSIAWAPSSTIIRQAQGSDNWPLTWGDDDNLYAVYGDGNGFVPMIPEKLSLGFAVVYGSPPAFSGVNFRSPTGEQTGDGETGKKASSILMVDGVLYMWVRNAGNSQLAWSGDYGRTWSWSTWKFTTSFAFPAFLNFGKNYAGARDEYVYVYSPDNDNAYAAADRMVLARVPKGTITNQAAYEFFNGLDASGNPLWTTDIAQRQAVFTHPGKSFRSSISYHAASKRYLWIQTLPGADLFLGGGFGIYDAPEPWGPWTTAYFTDQWDVSPGEMGSFPTKWMSDDGVTLYMVFSDSDSFSVRMATLTLDDPASSPPTAATNAATSVTSDGATLNGGVNPNGAATTAWFEWGTDPTLATFSVTSSQSMGSGTSSQPLNTAVSGWSPGTTYYFRVAASNAVGTAKGSILSVGTSTDAPTAATNAATSVTSDGATLNGGVNPNGAATTAWFEWGTGPTLATFSVTSSQSMGSGTSSQPVNAAVSGWSPGTTYYFRTAASNAGGTAKGTILSVSTSTDAPTAATNAATSVTSGGATLNGGVNPNGAATTAWFEWGADPTLATFSVTSSQSMGSGTSSQPVNSAVSGLISGTTYYFRVAASNATGTAKGSIAGFTVLGAGPPVNRLWIPAVSGTLSGKMSVGTDYASNSLAGTVVYPNTTEWNTDNHTQADAVAYTVTIPAAGTWYLWSRMYYPGTTAQPTNDPNSFWVAIDSVAAKSLGNRTDVDRIWHWEGASGSLLSLGNVSAGNHTLRVWNREARETAASKLSPRLDVFLLTSDAGYIPNDVDAANALKPTPTATTNAATSVTSGGATLNGGVNPNGAATTAWFEWGTSPTLATFSSTTSQSMGSGTTSQPASAALSGLASGTPYYFRAAASNAAGTVKGSILSFTTTIPLLPPTATTNAATAITATGGTVNGGVNPNGAATTAWFEWGTSPTLATFSSTTSQSMGSGMSSQAASATLSGLSPVTPYYFRAAASNAVGTVKGSILTFSTAAVPAPTATTNAATSVTTGGATLNGGVNPNGAATTAWFEWGTDPALATFSSTTSQSMGSGTASQAASAALSGLTSGTPYYFRAAASNAAGTVKGSILSFTTAIPLPAPTTTTNAATSVTFGGAMLNGGVNPNGVATTAWFEWGTSPTLATFSVTSNQSMGSGTSSQAASAALSGLSPVTTYYFRAAASNGGGTAKGSILTFSTAAAPAPTATTNAATSVTNVGATLNGGVNPNGVATTAWFEWGTSPTLSTFSVTPNQSMGSGTSSQAASAVLSGLSPGTPYYFRAAASNAGGTAKGSILTFSTAATPPPTATTNAATSVTAGGARLNGGVNPNGVATTAWFEWSADPTLSTFSVTPNQSMGSGTSSLSASATVSGLTSGTPYYFRAAASNAGGTVKGSIRSFTTTVSSQAPRVTSNAATSVTSGGATLNGSVNPNRRSTTAWFEWGTTPTLYTFSVTPNQSMGSGSTNRAVSAPASGLSPGTTYYFRVAASNSAGIVKGSIRSFTTTIPLPAPNASTNPANSIAINSAMLSGDVNPNGVSTAAWFEWGTSPTLATFSSTTSQSMGSGTSSQPVNAPATGLNPGTTYYFRAAASNAGGTTKGSIRSFTTATISTFDWAVATPESQGLSTVKLDSLWSSLQARNTVSFLVIRNDKIVYEKYVSFNRHQTHYTASMVKGLTGGMSLMLAMNDGLIAHDDLVMKYVPQWGSDPNKSTIKVNQLATHTSGLDDATEGDIPHDQLTGWKGDFWKLLPEPSDPFTLSRDNDPVIHPPGTTMYYSNPGYAMLGYAVTASIKGTANQDIRSLLDNRIMRPIGIPSTEWNFGYNDVFLVDGLPLVPTWGGGNYSTDATARVGRLVLRQGDWEGNQIISGDVVQAATTHLPGLPGNSLFGWYGNVDGDGGQPSPSLPRDAIYATPGNGHQMLLVIPSLNLIMVRFGELLDSGDFDLAIENYLFAPLMSTVIRPTATTNAATSITATGGTVNGGVNPNGVSTTAWFEWGTDPTLATFSSTTSQSMGSGTTSQAVSAALSGLTSGTPYYFRVAASNAAGTVKGSILSFSTTAVVPTVTTNAATSITATGGTVNGGVNPNGAATTAWFEWGTSPTLATFSSTTSQSMGSGTTSQPVSAALSGLTSGTPYYFRAAASNAAGTVKGSILSFSTTAVVPTATTNAATSITATGGTVNGGREPERCGDDRVVRVGDQPDPGDLQQHDQPVDGFGDDEPGGERGAVGVDLRDAVLLPGGGFQRRGDRQGIDPQLHHHHTSSAADGDDERGHLHHGDRRHGERRGEPERRVDDRMVRVGDRPDPGDFQQHDQPVDGFGDDEPAGERGAVGVGLRDAVLLPGGGFQCRGDRQGIDPQLQHHGGRSDGDDERGHLHHGDRRHGERGGEPERRVDDRVVRVGDQPDPGDLQQHDQPVDGFRDDEPAGERGAVGVDLRDAVLLPGGGFQRRGDRQGVDPHIQRHRRPGPDGDDERGHLHHGDRRHGERRGEPERRGDDRLVRVGDRPGPGDLQQHDQPVPRIRDDDDSIERVDFGAGSLEDVLLPGSRNQQRRNAERRR